MSPFIGAMHPRRTQAGMTLIVGMIMLILITLLVVNAFGLSSSNLKMVNNMQVRGEAVAAANRAVEFLISSNFFNSVTAQTIDVDINNDGTTDYTVNVAIPTCLKKVSLTSSSAVGAEANDSSFPTEDAATTEYRTDWDLDTNVVDAVSGASVRVRQGIRVVLSQAQANTACP